MCGILGYSGNSHSFSKTSFEDALKMLSHRGPDDDGVKYDILNNDIIIALGHRRLSILDTSCLGHQPMVSSVSGATIVYNGEIYNFNEIKILLEKEGYAFQSRCDTEVILAAYDKWGKHCVDHFNGMFSFSIYDNINNKIFLARDRIGIKPLFYYHYNNIFAFSSELIPLISALDINNNELDIDSIYEYFTFGYFYRQSTPLKNYYKLPPAHYLEYDISHNRVSLTNYWSPADYTINPLSCDNNEAALKLETLLEDSVQKRLISDVPIGAFLSGGIDSSLIVALMSRLIPGKVKTFTIGFSVPKMDEAPYARKIASYLGTEHEEMYISLDNLMDAIIDATLIYDEPFADSSCIPTLLLSKMTRKSVTVALGGDGGDELHVGYQRYCKSDTYAKFNNMPHWLRNIVLLVMKHSHFNKLQRAGNILGEKTIADFYRRIVSRNFNDFFNRHNIELMWDIQSKHIIKHLGQEHIKEFPQIMDELSYLPDDLLTKVDRASMSVSLEARVPLLDHRIIEFSNALPRHVKYYNSTKKYLLKNILSKYIPNELWNRKKAGFAIPLDLWFRKDLKSWVMDELTSNWDWTCGIMSKKFTLNQIEKHMNEKADNSKFIWSVLSWKSWAKRAGIIS